MTSKQERLKEVYEHLRANFGIHTQVDFANAISITRPALSSAMNGNEAYLTKNLFQKICFAFPGVFNLDYLLNGCGALFAHEENKKSNEQPVSQEPIDHSSLINALLASKDETIAAQQREIEAKDELIASLKSNLNDLRASLLNGNLKDYPFDMGVAENPVNNSKRV